MARLVIDGYGQLEINNCAFRRDGRIEAQCALDTTDFNGKVAENGMILAVDNVNRVVKFAVNTSLPVAINYSSEHIYDERTPGLKNFALGTNDFYPRLGYLSVGDKFTTNCISYNTTEFATETALKSAVESGTVYGTTSSDGSIAVSTTVPTVGVVLRAVKGTTMPDGQYGVKFQVYNA